jgi:hypothetical protein
LDATDLAIERGHILQHGRPSGTPACLLNAIADIPKVVCPDRAACALDTVREACDRYGVAARYSIPQPRCIRLGYAPEIGEYPALERDISAA